MTIDIKGPELKELKPRILVQVWVEQEEMQLTA